MAGSPVDILTGIVEITADSTKFDKALGELRGKAANIPGMLQALGSDKDIGQKLIEMHNQALTSATNNMLKDWAGGGGGNGGGVGGIASRLLSSLGGGAAGLASGGSFGMVSGALGGMAGPYGAAAGTALGAIPKLVEAFNPVAVEKFDYILKDVTAVIGDRLQPVLEIVGEGFRLMGDVLESVLPGQEEMAQTMKPLKEALDSLRMAFGDMVPFIRGALLAGLESFAKSLQFAAKVLDVLTARGTGEAPLWLKMIAPASADILAKGFGTEGTGLNSSAGKGFQGAAQMTDFRAYYNQMAVNAVKQASLTPDGEMIKDKFGEVLEKFDDFNQRLLDAINNGGVIE